MKDFRVKQLAEHLALWLEAQAVDDMDWHKIMDEALSRMQRTKDRRQNWARRNGLISADEYCRRHGLTYAQLNFAVHKMTIEGYRPPGETRSSAACLYYPDC